MSAAPPDPDLDRRAFLAILACGMLSGPVGAVEAQRASKVPRIGVLQWWGAGSPFSEWFVVTFREGLRELGYGEGADDSAVAARAGGSGHPVTARRLRGRIG